MNNRIYHVVTDILNRIIAFLPVYAVMSTVLLFFNISSLWPLAILPLSGLLLSYIMRNQLKHIWSFLLLHLLLITIIFLLSPALLPKILFSAYMLIISIYELSQRLKEENLRKANSNPSLLLVFILLILLNTQLHLEYLNTFLLQLTVIFIVLYFINSYLVNFEQYFTLQQETSNVPFRQIKAANHTIILFFLGIAFACMISFTKLPMSKLFYALVNGFLSFLRWFFSLFGGSHNKVLPQEESTPSYPLNDYEEIMELPQSSPLMEYIQKILMVVLSIAAVIALLALLSYAVYKIYQAFYGDKKNLLRDSTEFLSPFDRKEKIHSNAPHIRKKRVSLPLWNQTNSDKIRKSFYKAILSNKNEKPGISATPFELSYYILTDNQTVSPGIKEQVESLNFYYEKARYSREECSKNDLKEFKELLRNKD